MKEDMKRAIDKFYRESAQRLASESLEGSKNIHSVDNIISSEKTQREAIADFYSKKPCERLVTINHNSMVDDFSNEHLSQSNEVDQFGKETSSQEVSLDSSLDRQRKSIENFYAKPPSERLITLGNGDSRVGSTTVGVTSGTIGSSENYADNVILRANRGHGFAAEKANHLNDVFSGKNAKIIGGDNAKNGADRLVDGVNIQTKYCKTGSRCISECFENGIFRYVNSDGSPMQIEVPSDKYDSAVQAMENRIKSGQVPGVSDPKMAKDIVRKGAFTYEQVRNITKFGTVESLTYDAVNGIRLAGTAMGISAAVSFAVSLWNGEDWEDALEGACYTGLKVGGVAWVSSVITAQLGRTGIEQGLRGATDWIVKHMGAEAASWIANGLRSGNSIYGAAAMNHVSKLLRGNIVTGVVTTLVISSVDFVRLFQGKVSGAQLFKNVATTASGVAGGTGGWMAGAAGGAAIGSAVPVIGTAAGGIIGGLLGAFAGGTAASKVATTVLGEFIEDDAKEMLSIVEKVFGDLAFNYLLSEKEAKAAIDEFKSGDIPDFLRDMYASDSRTSFAKRKLEPIVIEIAKNRKIVSLPTEKEIIRKTGEVIDSLVDAV